jgi:pimeloyl-ACP methyl ester carboxylesterase
MYGDEVRYIGMITNQPSWSGPFGLVVTSTGHGAGGFGPRRGHVWCDTLFPVTFGARPTRCPTLMIWGGKDSVRFTYAVIGGI